MALSGGGSNAWPSNSVSPGGALTQGYPLPRDRNPFDTGHHVGGFEWLLQLPGESLWYEGQIEVKVIARAVK